MIGVIIKVNVVGMNVNANALLHTTWKSKGPHQASESALGMGLEPM